MVHFQQSNPSRKGRRAMVISLAVFLAVLIVFLLSLDSMSEGTARRQRESLEKALNRCVTYCYAVEGAYPESLTYMKENYGLTYDEGRFFVDYRYLGSNMLPDITIIEKEDG